MSVLIEEGLGLARDSFSGMLGTLNRALKILLRAHSSRLVICRGPDFKQGALFCGQYLYKLIRTLYGKMSLCVISAIMF
jgi:hypothetical protein